MLVSADNWLGVRPASGFLAELAGEPGGTDPQARRDRGGVRGRLVGIRRRRGSSSSGGGHASLLYQAN